MNLPIQLISFLSKTLRKNSVFQKTIFYFLFFTQFLFYCEEFWESSYKLSCSQSRTSFKAYRLHCNQLKKVSSWCKEKLYRLDKGCFVKWCTIVDLGCIKIRTRKISSGLLENWHGSKGPKQNKIFSVSFAFWNYLEGGE